MSAFLPRLLVTAGAVALGLSAPAAALADPGGDPAGNNGTIKIQPYGGAAGNANHPHPGCDFRLQLFGFDDDQTGTITFTGQAPTAGAVTAQPLSGSRLLSDDAARGGQDDDASFDVRGADLGLTGAPAAQGYHVKVRVDADDAPGGAKTKVFWLDCPAPAAAPAAPVTSTETAPAPASSTTEATQPAAGSTTLTTTAVQGETSGATLGGATAGLAAPEASAQDSAAELTTFTGGSAGAVRGSAVTGGRTAAPGGDASALPFTGVPALALAGLGLGTLAAGTLAVRAGRRRTSQV